MTTKENILKKYSSPYNLYFRFRHFFPKILRPYIESIIFTPPTATKIPINSTCVFHLAIIVYLQILLLR